jgi:Annexin
LQGPFIELLTKCSWDQIQAIKAAYESKYNCSLQHAIQGETSGVFEAGLVLLLSAPDDQYALALHRAFAGLGTNDAAVARVLGSNDKADVARIAARFFERYVTLLKLFLYTMCTLW